MGHFSTNRSFPLAHAGLQLRGVVFSLEAFVLGHLNTEDQTINGLTAPCLGIRTVETVEGWVFGAYVAEEPGLDLGDLTFSDTFARDIVYTEPIDLSGINQAAAGSAVTIGRSLCT